MISLATAINLHQSLDAGQAITSKFPDVEKQEVILTGQLDF